jgi:hypothetical protein
MILGVVDIVGMDLSAGAFQEWGTATRPSRNDGRIAQDRRGQAEFGLDESRPLSRFRRSGESRQPPWRGAVTGADRHDDIQCRTAPGRRHPSAMPGEHQSSRTRKEE